jgi:transcriptional regulator with XRE-family HTH domain
LTESNTRNGERERDMLRGKRLQRDIHRAMAAADVPSLAELSRQSRVQRDTLYAWFRGERPPKPDTLSKVAAALGVRIGDLWDYAPAPVSEELTLTDLVGELRQWRIEDRARIADLELAVARLVAARLSEPADEGPGALRAPRSRTE